MNKRTKQAGAILLALMMLSSFVYGAAADLLEMVLPASLKIIREEAFYGNTSIEKVIVPDGTTEIRGRAFADSSMTELVLPGSLTYIAEDAFEGCGEIALTVPEHCYAYNRCIELGLIERPEVSQMESAHPYADEFDYTWVYDAGEGTESVTITFSADTETEEDYDFIYIYTLNDVEVGKYSGTELAGKSVTVDGDGFKLRLTSDEAWGGGNAYYGFRLESIVPKKAVPLHFESITAESSTVNAGEIIRWTVATTGGKAPVYYDYTVLLGEEEVATGTVEAPNTIEYTPVRAGEYKLSVIARDSADVVLPAQRSDAVTVAPSTAYPESAHPYAANTDQRWVYAAEENVESLTVTFSEETKTQSNYDYIWIYDQYGTQIGKYSGTQLAGQTIEIMGSAFTIRLTSNGSTQYNGFTITNIEKYIPGPLTFVSLTVDKAKAKAGDLLTWTMETEGGIRPVTYEYTVTLNDEIVHSGSVFRPEQITYVPMEAGDYTMSVVTKDAEGNMLPAQTSKARIAERGETAAEYFTAEQIAGNFAQITAYTGPDTAVVIPEKIGEYTIESIGASAFKNNTDLVSVVMPETLKSIGANAFYGCTSLQAVGLNNGLESIGSDAFYGCTRLKEIELPEGLEVIYARAFMNCTELTEMYIPDSVTTLSYRAFYGCSSLSEINYPMGWVTTLDSRNYKDSYTPTTPSYFGGIFAGTALKTMHVPSGATVPAYAFKDCPNLTSITIAESDVKLVGNWYHFSGCTGLSEMKLPENWVNLPSHMFDGCTGLMKVELSAATESIGSDAFYGCMHLKEIKLPEGLEVIYARAFMNCTELTEMYIPDSVTTLSYRVFYGCSSLVKINYPMGWITTLDSRNYKDSYIPTTPSYFGGIFAGTALKTMHVPSGATVPAYAFKDCPNLTSITIAESDVELVGDYYHFSGCTGLTEIKLPENWIKLPRSIFENCVRLVKVELSAETESIGADAFYGCTRLKEIELPEGLEVIYARAFMNCTELTEMYIPDSVTTLSYRVFYGCSSLSEINYPMGWVTTLDSTGRTDSYTPTTPSYFGGIFAGTALKTMYVPSGATVPAYAFKDCPNLVSITIAESDVKLVGDYYHFSGCIGLTEMKLPENWISLPRSMFEGCTGLVKIELSAATESIGADVFYSCTRLKEIELPQTLTNIGSYAFYGNEELEKIYIPSSVTSIGESAFAKCPDLKIYCEYGSYALQYAMDNGIPYFYLSLTDAWCPSGSLYKGDVYPIRGMVRCSEYIDNVTVELFASDGESLLRSGTITPNNATVVNVNQSLNHYINISTLETGSYVYRISAISGEESEQFVASSFSVIPPPVRISVLCSSYPTGVVAAGANVSFAGTVSSNYVINNVSASLQNSKTGETVMSWNAAPQAYSCELQALCGIISTSSLANGSYRFTASATANGVRRSIANASFVIGSMDASESSGAIDTLEERNALAVKLASDPNNRKAFYTYNSYTQVFDELGYDDALNMALNIDYLSEGWNLIVGLFKGHGANESLVKLYKKSFADIINKSLASQEEQFTAANTDAYKLIVDTVKAYGKLETEVIDQMYDGQVVDPAVVDGFKDIVAITEAADLLSKFPQAVEDAIGIMEVLLRDYEGGYRLLVTLKLNTQATDAEFNVALNELLTEYTDAYMNGCRYLIDRVVEEASKNGIKAAMKYLTGANYSLAKLGAKIVLEVTGSSKAADNYQAFYVNVNLFCDLLPAYYRAFDRVANGDHSETACEDLYNSYIVAHSAGLQMYDAAIKVASSSLDVTLKKDKSSLAALTFSQIANYGIPNGTSNSKGGFR